MNSHKEKAAELFLKGHNCSQSVFAAYAEDCGLDLETALKISSSFGGGFGRLREVCGCVSAMMLVTGCLKGYSSCEKADKDKHYALVQSLAAEFKKERGSIICREILKTTDTSPVSAPRTPDFYKKRPCLKCIESACEILDRAFFAE